MDLSLDLYHRVLRFAAQAHGEQRLPGSQLPYVVHLAGVAMEVVASTAAPSAATAPPFNLGLAVTCALLHDTIEDTATTADALAQTFGPAVAQIVSALSKEPALPKWARMADSLTRIAALPPTLRREAAIVKLADRITNLQPPPAHWTADKRTAYQAEARLLLTHLEPLANWPPLAQRLSERITAYGAFLSPT